MKFENCGGDCEKFVSDLSKVKKSAAIPHL